MNRLDKRLRAVQDFALHNALHGHELLVRERAESRTEGVWVDEEFFDGHGFG